MIKKIKATTEKCSNCGFNMVFDPEKHCLSCPACSYKETLSSKPGLNKHLLNDNDENLNKENESWGKQMKLLSCQNCGASSILKSFQTATTCSYCNSPLIDENKHYSGLRPDAIIPFQFGKDKAQQLFQEKLRKKWFLPIGFKNQTINSEMHAYYFPSFVFDANCLTTYDGRLYKNIETKNSDGFTETTKKYFNINGTKESHHKNIMIEASNHLDQHELESIEPFDLKQAKNYMDEYVQGYSLESYNKSVEDSFEHAKFIIKSEIEDLILKKHKHDGVDRLDLNTIYTDKQYSYCVLPLYRINYKYKNKNYSNVMNGQTGALGGKYPKSALKISLLIIGIALIVLLPILMFAMNVL